MHIAYILFIFFLFLLSLPLQLIIALLLVILSGWPILFFQKRVGKDGKIFIMYKFRTMNVGSEEQQKKLQKLNEADGPAFKIHDDPRYTPFGKFLSHTGLDELPQLMNILKGDMALFGPRPLPVNEAHKLTRWQQGRHCIKPGIISPWIMEGYHKKRFDDWMKSDMAYVKNKSFTYDLKLFFRSFLFMVRLFTVELLSR